MHDADQTEQDNKIRNGTVLAKKCQETGVTKQSTQPARRHTVHDTENLTFSAEFRDCSARNDAEFPRGCRGTSARAPRNFRAG